MLNVVTQNSKDMMFLQHDLVTEKFTLVKRRVEFHFK